MSIVKKPSLTLLLISTFLWASAQDYPAVEIPGSHTRTLHSEIVNQEYTLQINLPNGYQDSNEKYGVVYLLDSQWDFPLMHAIYGEQYFDGFLPSLIIVGITWGGEGADPNLLRARDYSPSYVSTVPQSGGADAFLAFLKEELTPFIEKEYRVKKNDRTLIGSSLGGLFTFYATFRAPGFFQRCIPSSPAVGWDSGLIFDIEESFSQKNKKLNTRLYTVVGGLESSVPDFNRFVENLKSRNYKGFEFEAKIMAGMGHSGCKAEGNTRGMQFVYQRNKFPIAARQLPDYIGDFRSDNDRFSIINENGVLYCVDLFGHRLKLQAETSTKFYHPGRFLNLEFKRNENDEFASCTLHRYGSSTEYKKL